MIGSYSLRMRALVLVRISIWSIGRRVILKGALGQGLDLLATVLTMCFESWVFFITEI